MPVYTKKDIFQHCIVLYNSQNSFTQDSTMLLNDIINTIRNKQRNNINIYLYVPKRCFCKVTLQRFVILLYFILYKQLRKWRSHDMSSNTTI